MVRCPKCGCNIKYIPQDPGVIMVDADYTELINDSGRAIKGYLPHVCSKKEAIPNVGNVEVK